MKYIFIVMAALLLLGCNEGTRKPLNEFTNNDASKFQEVCYDGQTYVAYYMYHQFGLTTKLDKNGKPIQCQGESYAD
jgi:outer membrane biogenesis lipoprotein LolB